MRALQTLCVLVFLGGALGVSAAQSRQASDQPQARADSPSTPVTTVNDAVNRIIAREHDEVAIIRRYNPVVETYVQEMKPDKALGSVPARDHYFLGQANLGKGVWDDSMLASKHDALSDLNPLSHLSAYFTSGYNPEGFLQMVYVDNSGFDRQHYQFEYVRREFLGNVRCLVFDVTPLPHSGRGRFRGRIWAEDQNFTIVRFNGDYSPVSGVNGYKLHFDSWRTNVQPGLWLPAFIFSENADTHNLLGGGTRFKAQTRLWGYDLKNAGHEQEFSQLTIESPSVQDQAAAQQTDRSPIEAERAWQHEAEVNVLDRLERTGLLAPPGEVDKLLETVVNNLEVTNNLDIEPEVHCRILLTGTLESFAIGHTIVLSRGLLDVLPDEASIATMLAQELADIIVTNPSTDQYGFNDTTNVSAIEVLSRFSFRDNPAQLELANKKALDILKNSPYKAKLGNAGLFLKQLASESDSLKAMINPRLGNGVNLANQLIALAPPLQPDKLDQIAALPIGARIKMDPWNDHVALLKAKAVPLLSAREKMPFEVTPFMPFLTRYDSGSTITADPSRTDLAKKQQPPPQP